MAELLSVGEYVGKGEKPTAEHLARNLPDDWTVIANVVLPGAFKSEVDLIVIGYNRVFLIEEKSWGPEIVIGPSRWKTGGGQEENSPSLLIERKAKEFAGLLKRWLPQYSAIGRDRPVLSGVILSYEDLILRGNNGAGHLIMPLVDAVQTLVRIDREVQTQLQAYRPMIAQNTAGFSPRPHELRSIGNYQVTQVLPDYDHVRRFEGEHSLNGSRVMLYCFPDYLHDRDQYIRAIEKLRETGRTWQSSDRFLYDNLSWTVLPLRYPEPGITLGSFPPEITDRGEWKKDTEFTGWDELRFARLFADSFLGLSDIHSEGVVHRALCPERIWLGRSDRVLFHDFFQARVPAGATISISASDELSAPYVAPEASEDLHLATPKSDVYSLARVLCEWWANTEFPEAKSAQSWLLEQGELGLVLSGALSEAPANRPDAKELSAQLKAVERNLIAPQEVARVGHDFEVGKQVGDYFLERNLGSGGAGSVWLATHQVDQTWYALKQAKSAEDFDFARTHLATARKITHSQCQKYKTASTTPSPGFFVHEYVEGMSISDRHAEDNLSAEAFRKIAIDAFQTLATGFHRLGLVHGDASPQNLLVDDELRVHFIDLETVSEFGSRAEKFTPSVASPEMLTGDKMHSGATDVYALSATLIQEMLSRFPYEGSPADRKRSVAIKELTVAEQNSWSATGVAVLKTLFTGVSPDPEKRPSAEEMFLKLKRARGVDPAREPLVGQADLVNPTVAEIRKTYVASRAGNEGLLAGENSFLDATYADTELDSVLLPEILDGRYSSVVLAGNPGDGKTTFLFNVLSKLRESDAEIVEEDGAGWRAKLDGHEFVALLDASESHAGTSSNSRLKYAFESVSSDPVKTVLIAINDGRLAQFIDENDQDFPELQKAYEMYLENQDGLVGKSLIVNLKLRALTGLESPGLAGRIIDRVVDSSFWDEAACGECASQYQCPIFQNVRELRGGAKAGIETLTRLSFVASSKRATVRDFRSALAWVITGDKSCEDIHSLRASNQDASADSHVLLWDLAFEPGYDGDKLIGEWQSWDPQLSNPVEVRLGAGSINDSDMDIGDSRRKVFFSPSIASKESERFELLPYRFAQEFFEMLKGNPGGQILGKVLLGLSRIFGAQAVQDPGVWLAGRKSKDSWQFLRKLESGRFSLGTSVKSTKWTENYPSTIRLTYESPRSAVSVDINLDVFEVLMRAAEGEIFGDSGAVSTIEYLAPIMRIIGQDGGTTGVLVSPRGDQHRIEIEDNTIIYKGLG